MVSIYDNFNGKTWNQMTAVAQELAQSPFSYSLETKKQFLYKLTEFIHQQTSINAPDWDLLDRSVSQLATDFPSQLHPEVCKQLAEIERVAKRQIRFLFKKDLIPVHIQGPQ